MRYTTTDGPSKDLNAIQDGSLGDIMGIAADRKTYHPCWKYMAHYSKPQDKPSISLENSHEDG